MLEKQHLRIVKAISEEKTLTEASDKLCVTQSALSHSIKKIERYYDTQIWIKQGRHLHLTQAGLEILKLAKRVLPHFDHVENNIKQIAKGQKGTLRIGMECHPCYQWLLKAVKPYLNAYPDVDVDVLQKFKFGGLGALFNYDIDLLVTPDPFFKSSVIFEPVFDYEQVLVIHGNHPCLGKDYVMPDDISHETLITYPVDVTRLDIFNQFFLPHQSYPKKHKIIETTDIMLQMVEAGRGVAALPKWLVEEYQSKLDIAMIQLGEKGIPKNIHLGFRKSDEKIEYLKAFVDTAKQTKVEAEGYS
ncbi:MAG: LysR family transcriptional regulator [Pseudomonadota bacterium]